jgi:hypothetical protein
MRLPKPILLHIARTLHNKPNRPQHNTGNIPPRTKVMLTILRDIGTVDQRNGQRNSPDPKHLKDPEAEKREKLVALVVEAVILARLDDAEEEEAGEAEGPDD